MWKSNFTDSKSKICNQGSQFKSQHYEQSEYIPYSQTIGRRMNINEQNQVCKFCLGPHQTYRCSDKLCYNCGLSNHQISSCPYRKMLGNVTCGICGANGHSQQNCGKINMRSQNRAKINFLISVSGNKPHINFQESISQLNQNKNIQDSLQLDIKKLICMKCNSSTKNTSQQNILEQAQARGHYNCHKYVTIPQIYL